ncbi:MAG TPA: helix-turn-helix domain-containing protein [Blastocatellia bacterium]|nr:helix-turn-helix domain-containing protein [Blastocatellia bacterium]
MQTLNETQAGPEKGERMIQTRLQEVLEARGRSLYWLQAQTGIAYSTLHKLKSGRAGNITFPILDAICRTLEIQPGDLLVYTADSPRKSEGPARRAGSRPRPKSQVKAAAIAAGM